MFIFLWDTFMPVPDSVYALGRLKFIALMVVTGLTVSAECAARVRWKMRGLFRLEEIMPSYWLMRPGQELLDWFALRLRCCRTACVLFA